VYNNSNTLGREVILIVVTLFDESATLNSFHIDALIENGSLKIVGHDRGPVIENMYGEPEHEYFYKFTPDRTKYLYNCLKSDCLSDEDLLSLIQKLFTGNAVTRKLRDYCKMHDISFEYHDEI